MNEVIIRMLAGYKRRGLTDSLWALREILQQIALLGLWRAKFFDKAAFYGGTALRVLHGLDRFSEDLDFSLLAPDPRFDLQRYAPALEKEIAAFGFNLRCERPNTSRELLVIETPEEIAREVPRGQILKIKVEVDTEPPPGFATEVRFLFAPVPFAVRCYALPDLFAGKMHALLCRRWKSRVKGRDWYDMVWYAAHHPELHLAHLEQRMRQSGDWQGKEALTATAMRELLTGTIARLDVRRAREDVAPFIADPKTIDLWSREFFHQAAQRIIIA